MSYYTGEDLSVAAFRALVAQKLDPASVPRADAIEKSVPVYDMARLRPDLRGAARRGLQAEWAWVLKDGPGVLLLKNSFPDLAVIDRATALFDAIIAREAAAGGAKGDHFAKAGKNARIWNVAQKQCLADPEGFVLYHGNPAIDAVSEAWLGPGYQMTTQVNVVRPGGAAQTPHRDYHLGFMSAERIRDFPVHVHDLSPFLTLQGGIAHGDAPVEAGPTRLLPFSQSYGPGYLAYHEAEFAAVFADHAVQVPLDKGDVIFFNPALFHAAAENRTADMHRMVNLMQVCSGLGRAMEALDRAAMCRAIYPVLQRLAAAQEPDPAVDTAAAVAAAAEGYSFPTSLDTDPPVGGLAPETMAQLFHRALAAGMAPEAFAQALAAMAARRRA